MLARIQKSMTEKDEGFTLIELLVVIIIIGILAAIAIPVFLNQRKKATEASLKSDLRTVANQMETYYTDKQAYPLPASIVTTGTTVNIGGEPVKVSANNTIKAGSTQPAGGYCLIGVNSSSPTKFWYYNSTTGGLTDDNAIAVCGT